MSTQTVIVREDFDVIVSRSSVRDLARQIGMSTADQARISLATSSAARALGIGRTRQGKIVIQDVESEGVSGIRVVCEVEGGPDILPTAEMLADARAMTDELEIHALPTEQVQVTMIKWSR
jgi:serine/threonine-protein kinase RsbT